MTVAQPQPRISGDSAATPTESLPLSHRLSIIYLAAPVIVWLVGWFEWWIGLPVAGVLVAGLWGALSGSWRISLTLPVLVSLLAALAWMLLTPISGLWKPPNDTRWIITTLLDIGRGEWPTYLTDYLNNSSPLLSYYLGFHMVPGLVGRWLGSTSLSWALPLWTWSGIALLIIVFTRGLHTLRASLLAIVIFIFFSDMDALEYVLHLGPRDTLELMSSRLRRNLGLQSIIPTPSKLYPSYLPISVRLWWAPHYVIVSGLVSLIIIQSRHHLRFASISCLVLAICIFWSPFSAIGLLPLAATAVIKQGIRPFLTWPNLLASPPLIGLISLYLFNNDLPKGFGWLWQSYADNIQMLIDITWLYLTAFILLVFVLWRMNRHIIKEPVFVASLAVLAVAPWLVYSPEAVHGIIDDSIRVYSLTIRVVMPALVVLAYFTSRTLISRLPEIAHRSQRGFQLYNYRNPPHHTPLSTRLWPALLVAILAIGALTPLFRFLGSTNHNIFEYEQSYDKNAYEQTERTTLIKTPPTHGMRITMTTVPRLLQMFLKEPVRKGLSIGEPIIRSKYNIYLQNQDNTLVYINRNCITGSEKNTRFFLHIYPTDSDYLPIERQPAGFDIKENRWSFYSHGAEQCVATFGLPGYEISHIITGQYTSNLGIEWSVEYRFGDGKKKVTDHINRFDSADTYQAYYSYYQLATTHEPIIRSTFNVHQIQLHQNTLIYTKEHCTSQDSQTPFFLHVVPSDAEDLPAHRRESGFDNYDFVFSQKGTRFDDKCLAVIPIPDYSIATITTGQFDPTDGRRLWQEAVVPDL